MNAEQSEQIRRYAERRAILREFDEIVPDGPLMPDDDAGLVMPVLAAFLTIAVLWVAWWML